MDNPSLYLVFISTKTGRKRKRSHRYFLRKVNERVSIVRVSIIVKHLQNRGVAGDLSVVSHFFQRKPYKRVKPIYHSGEIHQHICEGIVMSVML